MIIGRTRELKTLKAITESKRAEFLAIYGRRRVGKTFLISEFFRDKGLYFELTGLKSATKTQQLKNFMKEFSSCFLEELAPSLIKDWNDAFEALKKKLDGIKAGQIILFFDELPWLDSKRSGFLSALDHFWNRHLSRDPRIVLIVCGSAASWMIKKVINNRAGLHGRLTKQMRLNPFTLQETELYLKSQGIEYEKKQVVELYMAFGGIPKYLAQIPKGKSVAQAIQLTCFDGRGALASEFQRLYDSLFDNANKHIAIVRELAKHHSGLTKNQILDKIPHLTSGGWSTEILNELEASGFITYLPQVGKKKKEGHYILTDEYSLFYLRWIEPIMGPGTRIANSQYWLKMGGSAAYNAWAGYSFESVCIKHINQIISALGLTAVATSYCTWRGEIGGVGAQIDLVIQRSDKSFNLCEIKFCDGPYTITKEYAEILKKKKRVFREINGTKETLFMVMITPEGVLENSAYFASIDDQITLEALFSVEQ